ncbi:NINE protein [Agrobacterium rubi]|uniref:NINE protein n=1 Tax=Agrobacterium rubi TaxID=28099 RepID=UPI00191EF051
MFIDLVLRWGIILVNVPKIQASQQPSAQMNVVVSKQKWVAYALHLLGGGGCFGLHRFYLGFTRSAKIQLVLGVVSLLLPFIIGPDVLTKAPFLVTLVWYVVDLFLIPGMVRAANSRAPGLRAP